MTPFLPPPLLPQKSGGLCSHFVNTSICDACPFHAAARLRRLEAKEPKFKTDARPKADARPRMEGGVRAAGGKGAMAGNARAAGGGWGNTGGGGDLESGLRMIEVATMFGLELQADGSLQPAANATERQVEKGNTRPQNPKNLGVE